GIPPPLPRPRRRSSAPPDAPPAWLFRPWLASLSATGPVCAPRSRTTTPRLETAEGGLRLGVEEVDVTRLDPERDGIPDAHLRVGVRLHDQSRVVGEADPDQCLPSEHLHVFGLSGERAEQPRSVLPDARVLGPHADDHLGGEIRRAGRRLDPNVA